MRLEHPLLPPLPIKPLLHLPPCSLILINEPLYGQLKQQIVASQMPDRQQHLAACLEKLMLVRLQRAQAAKSTGEGEAKRMGYLTSLQSDTCQVHGRRPTQPCGKHLQGLTFVPPEI